MHYYNNAFSYNINYNLKHHYNNTFSYNINYNLKHHYNNTNIFVLTQIELSHTEL